MTKSWKENGSSAGRERDVGLECVITQRRWEAEGCHRGQGEQGQDPLAWPALTGGCDDPCLLPVLQEGLAHFAGGQGSWGNETVLRPGKEEAASCGEPSVGIFGLVSQSPRGQDRSHQIGVEETLCLGARMDSKNLSHPGAG